VRFSAYVLVVGLSGLGVLRSVHAAELPVDDGLLEFLGSVDSEDKAWRDYLAGTDIDQVARRAGTAPGNPGANGPPASPPAAASPVPGSTPRPGAAPVPPP
jgi:hypothetical protein